MDRCVRCVIYLVTASTLSIVVDSCESSSDCASPRIRRDVSSEDEKYFHFIFWLVLSGIIIVFILQLIKAIIDKKCGNRRNYTVIPPPAQTNTSPQPAFTAQFGSFCAPVCLLHHPPYNVATSSHTGPTKNEPRPVTSSVNSPLLSNMDQLPALPPPPTPRQPLLN